MKECFLFFVMPVALLLTGCSSTGDKNKAGTTASMDTSSVALPANWVVVKQATGVICACGKRDKNMSDSDYVIIANLKLGASIQLLGDIDPASPTWPTFFSYSVTDTATGHTSFWNKFRNDSTFAMTNLEFFNYQGSQYRETQICYPVYYPGHLFRCGCADCCSADDTFKKRIVAISDSGIAISDYFDSTTFNKIVSDKSTLAAFVGNFPEIPGRRSGNNAARRTYIAKKGPNLIIYCSKYATQAELDTFIHTGFNIAFSDIVMFDGGGSTEMICGGIPYIESSDKPVGRWVPSAIEICHGHAGPNMPKRN